MDLSIEQIFKNSYTEINRNHDEALIVFRNYFKENEKNVSVLVHFDTHSDLRLNRSVEDPNLANWVNFAIKEFNIKEFYWVIPNYIIENDLYKSVYEKKQELFLNSNLLSFDNKKNDLNDINKAEYFFSKSTREVVSPSKISHINEKCKKFGMQPVINADFDYEKLNIYILPLAKLDVLKDKQCLISVDADFFCNTGYDTINRIGNLEMNNKELLQEFERFLLQIKYSKLNPVCTSLTYSPVYFPSSLNKYLEKFYSKIKSVSII